MATVNKNFKIKNGLVVEGSTATVNGQNILTETGSDQYILDLIGGETLVKSVDSSDFKVTAGGELQIDDAVSDLARTGDITDAIDDSLASGGAVDLAIDSKINAVTTDVIEEGSTNQYFTDARAKDVVENSRGKGLAWNVDTEKLDVNTIPAGGSTADSGLIVYPGTGPNAVSFVSIDRTYVDGWYDANGAAATAETNAIAHADALTTDDVAEGTNKYFSDSLARGAVSDGDGLNYDSNTGVFSAHLGNGLEISALGAIQIDGLVVATQSDLTDAIDDHNVTSGVHGVTGDILGTTDTQTISNKTLGGDLAAGGFKITNLGAPDNSTDAATKGYVDAVSEGLHVHEAARVAIQGNISIATGLENGDNAGGVTLATGNRVLVKDQTNPAENGIYVVQASGQALRATDFDTATEVDSGDFIFVTEGTYANTGWVQTLKPATIGTDALSFTQFSGAGTFTAGNGLTLDGTVFEIDETVTATRTYVNEELDAHIDLTDNVHGVTGSVVGTSDSQTLTNKTLGSGTVLSASIDAVNTYTIVNLEEPTGPQDAATKAYVDGEISTVNGTIDNLTTADVAEDPSYKYFTDQRALDATAAAYDMYGAAAAAQEAAEDYADGLAINYDAAGTAQGIVDALDTDDIEEGTAQYFTDARAKSSAADLLTGASLTNITITGTGAGLTITAENGVADSDTDDLTEGTSNLYFTNTRAVDALEAVVPDFTAVEINSLAKQVAATVSVPTAGQVTAYEFLGTEYRSAKFLIKTAYGSHTELTEVLLTLDQSNNIAITEYATVGTNGSSMTVTADYVEIGTTVRLRVTTLNNTSVVTVVGTLLA